MLLSALLEPRRKSFAGWYMIFRQSPKAKSFHQQSHTHAEMSMLTLHLSTPARAALAALALATVSSGANAFFSVYADPFLNQTVDLQGAPAGTWLQLPGLGYTQNFFINGFAGPSLNEDRYAYSANFTSALSDTEGGAVARTADLTGTNNFVVQFVGRTNPFTQATGTFDLVLMTADFLGTVEGKAVAVSLANIPTARINIAAHTGGGFDITYLTPFSVDGQYAINNGTPVKVPGLGDANGQPAAAPVPATVVLAIPGLLASGGLRRRRTAAAG
jgi:hypothetical protein